MTPQPVLGAGAGERFTAVVVTWNSAAEIPELVNSVERHLAGECELVFVDNASEDETVQVIRSRSPRSEVIALPHNAGFGRASNVGVRAATTEVVALLNPDTQVVDGSLARLAGVARAERALFGPRLLNEDGTPQISAFPPPAGWELGLIALWPGSLMPAAVRERCEPWRFGQRVEAGWLSAACLVARRDLLVELGPFDERLVLYGEDTDLGLRAWRAGVPSVFAPDVAQVVHLGSRAGSRAFSDAGLSRKIAARRWIVRHRLGSMRAAYDLSAQFVLHATRWLAKRALHRDASVESSWLTTAARGIRSKPSPDPGGSPPGSPGRFREAS